MKWKSAAESTLDLRMRIAFWIPKATNTQAQNMQCLLPSRYTIL